MHYNYKYLSSVYFTFETFRLEILFSFDDQSVNTFPKLERFCRTILNWTKLCTLLDLARYTLVKHNNNREQGQVLCTILFSSIVRQNPKCFFFYLKVSLLSVYCQIKPEYYIAKVTEHFSVHVLISITICMIRQDLENLISFALCIASSSWIKK